jgi:outer membrane murein-binding lipoprotein Lpp
VDELSLKVQELEKRLARLEGKGEASADAGEKAKVVELDKTVKTKRAAKNSG